MRYPVRSGRWREWMLGLAVLGCVAAPAHAVDLVPFGGFRFGGNVNAQPNGSDTPTSLSIDGGGSYGGIIEIPLYEPRSLEVYYSRQPTHLSAGLTPQSGSGVTVSVLHLGLADALHADDPRVTWLLIGSAGATELSYAGGGNATRFSIGLGGAVVWMPTPHFGLRGDLRALITFTGNGTGVVACNGGCTAAFASSVLAQGEATIGLVARF
jgi:hypothetical protein